MTDGTIFLLGPNFVAIGVVVFILPLLACDLSFC